MPRTSARRSASGPAWSGRGGPDVGCSTRRCTCACWRSSSDAPSRWNVDRTGRTWSRAARAFPPCRDDLASTACLGDRARLNANFRDEYYGMIPAVGDHDSGPPLVTSGLVDPGRSWWGGRPITFAKQRFERPRVDLDRLDDHMVRWAERRLVPKVLVANQTRIVEAVCDPHGEWLPGGARARRVPGRRPLGRRPSPGGCRPGSGGVGDRGGADVAGRLGLVVAPRRRNRAVGRRDPAVARDTGRAAVAERRPRLRRSTPCDDGDVRGCGAAVDGRVRHRRRSALAGWWSALLERIESRQPRSA